MPVRVAPVARIDAPIVIAASGVVDRHNRVFGYRNLLVCDGSAMPANPGVNPSLTITAMTEHAMSQIAPAAERVAQREVQQAVH